ncbi:hypothetical protein C0J52_26172 [Blattella germanica]|nr:hypothetical protein C0J52_26172 [Blattella germanica]
MIVRNLESWLKRSILTTLITPDIPTVSAELRATSQSCGHHLLQHKPCASLYAVKQFEEGAIFKIYGASSHYANIIRKFLDTFLDRIGLQEHSKELGEILNLKVMNERNFEQIGHGPVFYFLPHFHTLKIEEVVWYPSFSEDGRFNSLARSSKGRRKTIDLEVIDINK